MESLVNAAPGVEKILFTEEQVQARVAELGAQIACDYAGRAPVLVGILKGATLFVADLARELGQIASRQRTTEQRANDTAARPPRSPRLTRPASTGR